MLKLQPTIDFTQQNKTKCGEIFYKSFKDFTIFCTFCQMKSFQFEDFILHIQNDHLKNELHNEELDDYLKLNVRGENAIENDGKDLWSNIEKPSPYNSEDENDVVSSEEETLKVLNKPRDYKTNKNMRNNSKQTTKPTDELEIKQNEPFKDVAETLSNSTKKTKIFEYSCTECYEIFLQKKYLDQHVQDLHNGYKCSLCDKRFRRSSHVACHLKTHTTVKKFICSVENCGRGFIDEEYLKRHLEVHTMERSFICEYENCGKAFQTQRRLASHEYTHRIPKKFVCDVCGFGCRSNTVLITHQRVHTGEKPFPCEVCSKPFISKTALREHMISHSETRPHVCSICNKAFANRRVLVRHSYIHSDEKTFKCKLCESAFKHPNSLQGHMRHVHREPKARLSKKF